MTSQTPRRPDLSAVVMRLLEGFGIGVGIWCMGLAVDLLPGLLRDTPGVLLFAVVGAVGSVTKARPALVILCALFATVIVIVSETTISGALASRWVRADSLPAKLDAVVITSAGVNPNGTINGPALDHLLSGLELIRAGIADTLVSTTVVDEFQAAAVSSAVDQNRVIALFGGHVTMLRTDETESTRQEALASAKLLFPRKIFRIALVASPMHTRRACASFEAVGFTVTCVPARSRVPGGGWKPGRWPLDRLTVFGDWVYEIVATAMYRSRGWLTQAKVTAKHAQIRASPCDCCTSTTHGDSRHFGCASAIRVKSLCCNYLRDIAAVAKWDLGEVPSLLQREDQAHERAESRDVQSQTMTVVLPTSTPEYSRSAPLSVAESVA